MNTNTIENLSYSNSKRDHFSKITLLTDRSHLRKYGSMSKDMIKNELEIQKQKYKLLQLKNEKLRMEKKELERRRHRSFSNTRRANGGEKAIDDLKKKLKNLKEINTRLYSDTCCFREELGVLTQENECLKDERNSDNVKFFLLGTEIERILKENQKLKNNYEESIKFQKNAKCQLEIFKEKREEFEKIEELLKTEILTSEDLKKKLEEKEEEIVKFELGLKEKSTENEELKKILETLKNKGNLLSQRQTHNLDSFVLTQTSKNFTYSLVTQKEKNCHDENKSCSSSFLFLLLSQIYEKIKNMAETVKKNFRNSRERNLKKLKNSLENVKNFEKLGKLKEISHENLIEYHENILACVNLVRLMEVKTPAKMVNHSCETDILPSPNSFYIGDFDTRHDQKIQKSNIPKKNSNLEKSPDLRKERKRRKSNGFVGVKINETDFKFCNTEEEESKRGAKVEMKSIEEDLELQKTEKSQKIDSIFLQEGNEKIQTKSSNETSSWINHTQFNNLEALETPFLVEISNQKSHEIPINLGFTSPNSGFGIRTDAKNSRNLMIRSGSTSYFLEEESESKMKEFTQTKKLDERRRLVEVEESCDELIDDFCTEDVDNFRNEEIEKKIKEKKRTKVCRVELDLLAMGTDTSENYDSGFIDEVDNFENFKDNFKRKKIEKIDDDFSSEDEPSAVKYLDTDFKSSSKDFSNRFFEEGFFMKNPSNHSSKFETEGKEESLLHKKNSKRQFNDSYEKNEIIEDIYGLNLNLNKSPVSNSNDVGKSYETLEVKEISNKFYKKEKLNENQNIFNILKKAEFSKKNNEIKYIDKRGFGTFMSNEEMNFDTKPSQEKTLRLLEMESTSKKQIETKRKRGKSRNRGKMSSWRKKKESNEGADRRLSGVSNGRGRSSWGFNLVG